MIPNPLTAATVAQNLWSTATHQFAVWYRLDGELVIGRAKLDNPGRQRFGVDHTAWVMTGTPRTALALPVAPDEHNFPAVAVDGNGRIHVWANMHNNVIRYVRSVDPHTSDTWMAAAGWVDAGSEMPSVGDRNTYPTPSMFSDGSMFLYMRGDTDGVSGQHDSFYWPRTPTGTSWGTRVMLFQGNSVPDAGGVGVPGGGPLTATTDRTNWSAYPTNFYVESSREPHPDRMHMCWVWRTEGTPPATAPFNVLPSYAYSDNKGVTWRDIDGTVLTLPITPLNNQSCQMGNGAFVRSASRGSGIVIAELDRTPAAAGIIANQTTVCFGVVNTALDQAAVLVTATGTPTANSIAWGQAGGDIASAGTGMVTKRSYLNWGSMCVDPQGLPHILASGQPAVYIHRNANNTAWVEEVLDNPFGGFVTTSRHGGVFWLKGELWGLTVVWPSPARKVKLMCITNEGVNVTLSGVVAGSSGWDPSHDNELWRRRRRIATLAPDGDVPQVFSFGSGSTWVAG